MDAQVQDEVLHALIVPISTFNLVVPQSLVLEVLPLPDIQAVDGAEPWLKGFTEWQGSGLPLVSLTQLYGVDAAAEEPARRMAVLRSLDESLPLANYAIEIDSIPHPVKLKHSDLKVLAEPVLANNEFLQHQVDAAGVHAVMADFTAIEKRIAAVLPKV